MIQKEELQERRQELAEIRHAESVYRDILARENERGKYEKRWFWELLQNAKDSVSINEKVKVKIEISENQVAFSHTGNPFELDDILSLIIQGSSKNTDEGKTGRFGTGFLTTYLLSRKVQISGKLTKKQGCFQFVLNRDATDKEEFSKLQQKSNEEFEDSFRENSYIEDYEFQTKFTYFLDDKGKRTTAIGLKCLDELIPITQLFNDQIDSVTVIENEKIKTFSKSLIESPIKEIKEWEVNTIVDNISQKQLRAYIYNDEEYDSCIVTHFVDNVETVFPLSKNYPRLFFTFPLVGTEEIGIPIIINSINFTTRTERDGIYLKSDTEDVSNNKNLVSEALIKCLPAFAELFKTKHINDISELFAFQVSNNLDWIDSDWFIKIKNDVIKELANKSIIKIFSSDEKYECLNNIKIPYAKDNEDIKSLWDLLSEIKDIAVPTSEDLFNWIAVIKNIANLNNKDPYELSYVWAIKELIKQIEQKNTLDELKEALNSDIFQWLNDVYSLIDKISEAFPLEKQIIINQKNKIRKAEGMYWDACNDDALVDISNLANLNFSEKLIAKKITKFPIVGVEEFTKTDAIGELKTKLNGFSETDLQEEKTIEGNAKFLQWLIINDNKEVIKDLKILRNDEEDGYDYFPKTGHLPLSPKSFFENNFPLFSNLIRDKDCLNNRYNSYLSNSDYKYLSDNCFIYGSPLVTKKETATLKTLELLGIAEEDLKQLKDEDGQLKDKIEITITYSDFAYLTATDGHIYDRNKTQKSSLERFKFLFQEAVNKDPFFEVDNQEIAVEGIDKPIVLKQCIWAYRAKRLNWINIKSDSENTENDYIRETPNSKNLSDLLKGEETLIKDIRGAKQQTLLNKMGVGVSDLIRNTLPTDELRLSWDKAITKMIASDINPELVQEIFNDPSIQQEYQKRLNTKKIISRNQQIGYQIESLFKEYIEELKNDGYNVKIERKPFGSDYLITDESSDFVNQNNEREGFKINNWLIELKATGKDYAAMTPLQAETAKKQKGNYALIVVPLDGSEPDIEYVRQNAKVIHNIGDKIEKVYPEFEDIESKKLELNDGKDGISINIEDENVRFRVSSTIWNTDEIMNIETFIKNKFDKPDFFLK
ncbi:hypothetical protein AGMMS50262_08410 [Bacteroidia bacterium]|nr:hypothetical protein AGMMS50262_08410 [Bacteroidia bacterium]